MSGIDKPDKSTGTKDKVMSLRVDMATFERLKALSKATRRKLGALVALCVEDHLPDMEAEVRERLGNRATNKKTVV